MRIEEAHEARAQCAKQREVSPMKQGVPQASLRASEAAKRLEPRGHGAKRSPQGRNTAQALAQGGAKVWDDHAELRNSAKRSAAPEYRASEAQAGTKTPVRQGEPRVSLRTMRIDYAELRSSRSLRHGLRRATSLLNPSVAAAPRHLPFKKRPAIKSQEGINPK